MPKNLSLDQLRDIYQDMVLKFDEVEEMDFSKVDFFDTAGIQMILTFILSKEKREQDIKIVNLSEKYQDKIKTLGLWDIFEKRISQ